MEQMQSCTHQCRGLGQVVFSHAGAASRDCQVICPHQWSCSPAQFAEGFRQTPPHAKQGPRHLRGSGETWGKGWLVSDQQQLDYPFKPDPCGLWSPIKTLLLSCYWRLRGLPRLSRWPPRHHALSQAYGLLSLATCCWASPSSELQLVLLVEPTIPLVVP